MTQCGGVATSVSGEAAPGRGKGGDDISWANANLTEPKMGKINAVNSVASNGR
jgi:hypothetical protein